jgi:tRNA 2-thiouridine synthesizing protein A
VSHYHLDARRLLCPMPVIRTQNRMQDLLPGDTLEVICSDPGALHDIPAWCRIHGHEILSTSTRDGDIVITVRACSQPGVE